jgi:hypothetical protein
MYWRPPPPPPPPHHHNTHTQCHQPVRRKRSRTYRPYFVGGGMLCVAVSCAPIIAAAAGQQVTMEKTDTIMIRSLGREEKKTRIILIQCIWQYLVNSGPDSGLCCVRCPLQAEQLQAAELVGHAWRAQPTSCLQSLRRRLRIPRTP